MCGLSAIYYTESACLSSSPANVTTLLAASLENIGHRGPDSTGTWVSADSRVGKFLCLHSQTMGVSHASVGLGHVRLSIIDLETGQQPLSDEDDLIHCIVTGEIYDHERIRAELEAQGSVFKTKSDSELVLHLYGCHDFP
jgi:asparagine synthetase B (glutamine-hydrolysing)